MEVVLLFDGEGGRGGKFSCASEMILFKRSTAFRVLEECDMISIINMVEITMNYDDEL